MLVESRVGADITEDELLVLDEIISPLIMRDQSVHHIVAHNPDQFEVSGKSIYRYVPVDYSNSLIMVLSFQIQMLWSTGGAFTLTAHHKKTEKATIITLRKKTEVVVLKSKNA